MGAKIFMIFMLVVALLCPAIYCGLIGLSSWGVHDYDYAFIFFIISIILLIIFSVITRKILKGNN